MSESDNENYMEEEEAVDPGAHKKLLHAIGQLSKNQHIRKPTRSEPALARDEFHLVKPLSASVQTVSMGDVVKLLKKTSKHVEAGKELSKAQNHKKLLRRPLEKPVAERIQRTVGYEKAKKSLSRWDAVVERNRVAEHQVFPLDYEEVHVELPAPKKPRPTSIKSDLMLEMETVEAKLKELKGTQTSDDKVDEKAALERLTREELIARRKELAYLRMKESQKSARARLQNKIKSKKYHKFLKREKLKEEIKQFEILQKTNPEAALEKLEHIERNRVLERANLRHKNTGTWAKNLQVRAKYDKDVRKDLAEQLALSRELTEKKKADEESDKEAEENEGDGKVADEESYDPFNPWFKTNKKVDESAEVSEYLSGYRKYWTDRNENEKALKEFRNGCEDSKKTNETVDEVNDEENSSDNEEEESHVNVPSGNGKSADESSSQKGSDCSMQEQSDENRDSTDEYSESEIENFKTLLQNSGGKRGNDKERSSEKPDGKVKQVGNISTQSGIKKTAMNGKGKNAITSPKPTNTPPLKDCQTRKRTSTIFRSPVGDWIVEDITETRPPLYDIDDIFDDAENLLQRKVQEKISKLSQSLEHPKKNQKKKTKNDPKPNSSDLSFKTRPSRPEIDEQLLETPANEEPDKQVHDLSRIANQEISSVSNETGIDPEKVALVKPKSLKTVLPDLVNSDDFFEQDIAETKDRMTIAEAFEDDDVVADFVQDRVDERKKSANEDVDLTLPGWGTWAGCGISKEKQTKRLILKFPKDAPRRDDNKGNVYINEEENKSLKQHLVSDLPFPFTSVQEYEASIRAPTGREFVPETAFRMLTRPATVTKAGAVIEPMNDEFLVRAPRRPRTVVDKRIAILNGNKKKSK